MSCFLQIQLHFVTGVCCIKVVVQSSVYDFVNLNKFTYLNTFVIQLVSWYHCVQTIKILMYSLCKQQVAPANTKSYSSQYKTSGRFSKQCKKYLSKDNDIIGARSTSSIWKKQWQKNKGFDFIIAYKIEITHVLGDMEIFIQQPLASINAFFTALQCCFSKMACCTIFGARLFHCSCATVAHLGTPAILSISSKS